MFEMFIGSTLLIFLNKFSLMQGATISRFCLILLLIRCTKGKRKKLWHSDKISVKRPIIVNFKYTVVIKYPFDAVMYFNILFNKIYE